MKSYSLRDFLCIRFRPFWHIIHLEFTNFTFLLNRPIHRQCTVKGYSRFPASVLTTRMHGAYNSYARCIRIVSTKHMDGEHDTRKISNRHLEVYTE